MNNELTNQQVNAEKFEAFIREYWDYEKKRISKWELLDIMRDMFYRHETGMNYKEWREQQRNQSQAV